MHDQAVEVLEVPRPDRRIRRRRGKSDPIDAEAAARTVLAGEASGAPKLADGPIEAIRMLRVARLGAVTGVGHARLIFERFGRLWGSFAVVDHWSSTC